LNQSQLDYLSHTGQLHSLRNSSSNTILTYLGPNYIRPNQSCLHSHQHRQRQVKQEHENVMNTVRAYLVRVYDMPPTATVTKQFSQQLATGLHDRYMILIFYLNAYRAKKKRK
jgi:ABC-type dipeptide/oligopeptide/nickel transport system ATPase component